MTENSDFWDAGDSSILAMGIFYKMIFSMIYFIICPFIIVWKQILYRTEDRSNLRTSSELDFFTICRGLRKLNMITNERIRATNEN